MQRYFIVRFPSESDHCQFLSWLAAWEQESGFSTDAKIRFVRGGGVFSVWTIHSSEEHFEKLYNSVTAFNGIHDEDSAP